MINKILYILNIPLDLVRDFTIPQSDIETWDKYVAVI